MLHKIRQELIKEILPLVENITYYEKNEIIFDQDKILENILILLSGEVKLTHIIPTGKEFTLGVYNKTDIFLPSFFNERKNFNSLFRLQTISKCKIAYIQLDLILLNENLKMELLKYYDTLCQKNYLQMRDLIFLNNKLKLFSIFIRLSNSYGIKENNGIKIEMELSNLILSEYIGVAPETISRLIKELVLENIIEKNDRKIIVKNINFMKEKLNCSYCRSELCEI